VITGSPRGPKMLGAALSLGRTRAAAVPATPQQSAARHPDLSASSTGKGRSSGESSSATSLASLRSRPSRVSYSENRERGGDAVEKAIALALQSIAQGMSLRKASETHSAPYSSLNKAWAAMGGRDNNGAWQAFCRSVPPVPVVEPRPPPPEHRAHAGQAKEEGGEDGGEDGL